MGGMSAPSAAVAQAAHPGLTLGTLHVSTPVVLAPMAGITNAAYRRLCAEQGAGLYVCEMITSRGLVEGDAGAGEPSDPTAPCRENPIACVRP